MLPGIRAELAAAIRRVGAAYGQLPESRRPEINTDRWRELEAAIDRCCAHGDRDQALAAIEAWEQHALSELEEDAS